MNTREAKTYTSHIRLSQDDPKFWRFSFDEMGRYDVAACIDHVLNATGAPKLTIVAFSQGVLANLILHSVRPEYSEKVNLLVAYAPVANITHIEPPLGWLVPIIPILEPILYPLTDAGFLGTSTGLRDLLSAACNLIANPICANTFTITAYTSPEQFNKTRAPVYVGHFPTGSTYQNFLHYYQIYKARNLVMFDYGISANRQRYGQDTPPPYPMERIRLPIALFPSPGDTVATPSDVSDLVHTLGENVIFEHVVPETTFRHVDFATGYRANDILHNVAIELMRKYATEGH
ncbi:lysosomal acid lipase/cholesteryl ester hydrolase-like [Dermacentor variabilis]|uniref:lysosomal acid lipase/cholesteryl ester hydrolase-like n=1 Tax=Dermacentor variabilis TaxID=34621 RepID=UPI003F5C4307